MCAFCFLLSSKKLSLFKLTLDCKDNGLSSYFKGFISDLLIEKSIGLINCFDRFIEEILVAKNVFQNL